MKLFKLIKSVIVLTLLSVSVNAQTALQSQVIPYYGEDFYNDLKAGASNEVLRERIRTVLQSAHTTRDGGLDVVSKTCAGGGHCYSHQALGYKTARVFLMGKHYLVKKQNGYAVHDVYCDTDRDRNDFNSQEPGPGEIPNNTVVNVEHTWPQSHFTRRFPGDFQKSDLHHLFPSDSRVNAIRGNYMFGEVTRDLKTIDCSDARFGIGSAGTEEVFEPPRNHKGNVARAMFYFAVRYDMQISREEEVILRKWNSEDPVDADEVRRNDEIFKVQGNRNPFVDYPQLVNGLSDI